MVHSNWTDEELAVVDNAERNMRKVLADPKSSYTQIGEAINEFFATW